MNVELHRTKEPHALVQGADVADLGRAALAKIRRDKRVADTASRERLEKKAEAEADRFQKHARTVPPEDMSTVHEKREALEALHRSPLGRALKECMHEALGRRSLWSTIRFRDAKFIPLYPPEEGRGIAFDRCGFSFHWREGSILAWGQVDRRRALTDREVLDLDLADLEERMRERLAQISEHGFFGRPAD
jgi:hypothetical protein